MESTQPVGGSGARVLTRYRGTDSRLHHLSGLARWHCAVPARHARQAAVRVQHHHPLRPALRRRRLPRRGGGVTHRPHHRLRVVHRLHRHALHRRHLRRQRQRDRPVGVVVQRLCGQLGRHGDGGVGGRRHSVLRRTCTLARTAGHHQQPRSASGRYRLPLQPHCAAQLPHPYLPRLSAS